MPASGTGLKELSGIMSVGTSAVSSVSIPLSLLIGRTV